MKKTGSLQFFEDVDLNLKFDFDKLAEFHEADEEGIKEKLLDENENIKMDVLEHLVKIYVNQKIKDKFGREFSLDVMDDTMDISWDIKVKSIKKKHMEKWWNGENQPKEKIKSIEEQLADPLSIPEGLPEDRK
tara:strand:- start:81 stop:479 length:399 start_codon:yes stop_codon:yes gene_type:complete